MSESRVGELLRRSRSRHEVIISRELRKVSADYRSKRREAKEANEQLRKMMSEMRYFEALDSRLAKGVTSKRKELTGAESVRQRYLGDLRRVPPTLPRRKNYSSCGRSSCGRTAC